MGGHDGSPVRGDGLQVHVEGGLAVVLLPPARAPRGSVHAARLHVPGHRDTCPAHTCPVAGTRVLLTRLVSDTRVPIHCPLATIHSRTRSYGHVSCSHV